MLNEIKDAYLKTSNLIDESRNRSAFIYNDFSESRQVLKEILYHLSLCDEFYFSVAFINGSGLEKLKLALKEVVERGVKGKIISTNYLSFSDPKSLKFLDDNFDGNIETRMYYLTSEDKIGFHTKGYIFKEGEKYVAIIGSSNITASALMTNKEWNSEISGNLEDKVIKNILFEFNKMFDKARPLKEVLERYQLEYEANIRVRNEVNKKNQIETKIYSFQPNSMQKQVIFNTNELINAGEKRGLLISATGTGKTFASAFLTKGIEKFKVNNLLFIVHRETILKQAKKTFDLVFDNQIKSGIYTGKSKDIDDKNFIFASYSTLIQTREIDGVKVKDYKRFKQDQFDLIIIDEVHRVGDNHYQEIFDYFKPKFLLGMSATPDRTDGYDLYKLFDHNIIYEIRLLDALDLNLLTPFDYFGIKDITVRGQLIDDESDFNLLTSDERIKHILKEAKFYSYSGDRVRGLIFVSNVKIGKELSRKMNEKGLKTIFLDGSNSQKERDEAILKLESRSKNKEETLDYILTVDIFNEGVDIPSINQIILLRPTKSAIIFVQQIGRGLRKFVGKDYLVILDFIGNYKGNFKIAKAFNKGKTTKDVVIKTINDILPGEATINFDKVAKERIFDSIEKARINTKEEIYNDYLDLKNRLNHLPSLIEVDKFSTLSPSVFLDLKVFKSFYDFLYEKNFINEVLNEKEKLVLRYLSHSIFDGKRKLEIDVLAGLVNQGEFNLTNEILAKPYMASRIDEFLCTDNNDKPISLGKVDEINQKVIINNEFKTLLLNKTFKKYIDEGIEYAFYRNANQYDSLSSLKLYEKYSSFDITRLTNLSRKDKSTFYGYQVKEKEGVIPLLINYKKGNDDIQYEDHFIDSQHLLWSSREVDQRKHNYTKELNTINKIKRLLKEEKAELLVFVKKSNLKAINENTFYYLGRAKILNIDSETSLNSKGLLCYHFLLELEKPVPNDIYDYLTLVTNESIK